MIRQVVPGLLCAAALAISAPHANAAYLSVIAGWGANYGPGSDQPDAIDFQGTNDFESIGGGPLTHKVNESFTWTSSFSVTNLLDTPFFDDNFWIDVFFSAFTPESVGLSLDNAHQTGSFISMIEGPEVYDFHSCSLPEASPVNPEDYFTPLSCGVPGADFSDSPVYIGELAPHETQTFSYTITMADSFTPAPEPSSLAILALPIVFGLGFLLRREPPELHVVSR